MSFEEYGDFLQRNPPSADKAKTAMVVEVGKRIQGAAGQFFAMKGSGSKVDPIWTPPFQRHPVRGDARVTDRHRILRALWTLRWTPRCAPEGARSLFDRYFG
jgi:hypothetical protein